MTAQTYFNSGQCSERRSGNARILQYYVVLSLFAFGTALKPFLGADNRNLLLIGLMGLSSIFLLVARRIRKSHLALYFFMGSILLFPAIINPEHLRWSTILFSVMFSISFIAYENALQGSKMEIETFIKAIRVLLLAYFVVLVIQQIGVLTGLPILNESNYNAASAWKLNALAAEASHAARNTSVLMFAYLALEEVRTGKKYAFRTQFRRDQYLWLGYAWIVMTMQSTTSFFFAPLILFKSTNRRNFGFAVGALTIAMLLVTSFASDEFDRAATFVEAAFTFDYQRLMLADHSGSMRIAPMFVLMDKVELFSFAGLFGHGIDTVSTFMSDYIYGVYEGYTAGGMLQLWYEYGFITFALFIAFTLRIASALKSVANFIFWLLIVFTAGPNNQIVWLFLIVFASVEHFRNTALRERQLRFPMVAVTKRS